MTTSDKHPLAHKIFFVTSVALLSSISIDALAASADLGNEALNGITAESNKIVDMLTGTVFRVIATASLSGIGVWRFLSGNLQQGLTCFGGVIICNMVVPQILTGFSCTI
jgi:hypothetical protein